MNDLPDRSLSDADLAAWIRRHPEIWHFADDPTEAGTPEQRETLIAGATQYPGSTSANVVSSSMLSGWDNGVGSVYIT